MQSSFLVITSELEEMCISIIQSAFTLGSSKIELAKVDQPSEAQIEAFSG